MLDAYILVKFTVVLDANLLLLEFSPVLVVCAVKIDVTVVSGRVTPWLASHAEWISLLVDDNSTPFGVFEGYRESRWNLVFRIHLVGFEDG